MKTFVVASLAIRFLFGAETARHTTCFGPAVYTFLGSVTISL
jgi:hypothetical protein